MFFFFLFAGPFPTAGTARIPYQEEPVIGASGSELIEVVEQPGKDGVLGLGPRVLRG